MATRRARPALASQAEKANRSIGEAEKLVESSCKVQIERAIKRESIMASRHNKADKRWVRWSAKPISPNIKVDEKAKWVGVIR